jgi:adenine-specific DNA glycosylase
MSRGEWRARNLVLVRGNEPEAVIEMSTDALSKIPHPTKPISTLAKLAGVGPATASAVVAAAAPDLYPFFDELVAAQLPELGKVAWTLGYYARYAEALRARVRELGGDWTPVKLERALWALAGGKAGASG